ncbi:uncharacterized protein LOC144139654 [Haemaphysalis longicornis]
MPVIETPFQRVAIDIVGPLSPTTENGNRYVLTMVDFATRYPDAVALPSIDTERIAEALLEMFARVGFPREIVSDRELKDMVANLNVGAFSEAFAKINASVSNAQAGLGGIVDRLAAHARDHMVVYWLVVYLAIAGMCLVVALYAVGGVCGVWRMDRFYAGSWLLSSAVYLFVVSFPVVLLASTAGVVVSTAIERFFCVPAQSTDAVTFGPFFQFITLQLADQLKQRVENTS